MKAEINIQKIYYDVEFEREDNYDFELEIKFFPFTQLVNVKGIASLDDGYDEFDKDYEDIYDYQFHLCDADRIASGSPCKDGDFEFRMVNTSGMDKALEVKRSFLGSSRHQDYIIPFWEFKEVCKLCAREMLSEWNKAVQYA